MDNGTTAVADIAFVNTRGEFDVENVGVTPDVVLINNPAEVAKGNDMQLQKSIEMIMEMLENSETPIPDLPTKTPVR